MFMLRKTKESRLDKINNDFLFDINEMINNDSITAMINVSINKFNFIIDSVIAAHEGNRLFPDITMYYGSITKDDVTNFFTIFKSNKKELIDGFKECKKDINIIVVLGKYFVEDITKAQNILYFHIFTNKTSFTESKKISTSDIMFFTVENELKKEQQFNDLPNIDRQTMFVYHGTPTKNLFSILRNGIANVSNTKHMLNGDLQNKKGGVYTSNNPNEALTYAYNPFSCSGVLLIFESKNYSKKDVQFHSGVYVFQEEDIILRGFCYINSDYTNGDYRTFNFDLAKLNNLTLAFTNKLKENDTSNVVKYINPKDFEKIVDKKILQVKNPRLEPSIPDIKSKRFLKEVNQILDGKYDDIVNANNIIVGDINTPLLVEMKIPDDTKLLEQAKKHDINTIVFAIYVKENYPFSPPEIRIIRPIFKFLSGHVTSGGSICMELLYNDSWSPSMTIYSLLQAIISLLVSEENGNFLSSHGVIDVTRLNEEYRYSDYKDAFVRAALSHGWSYNK